MEKNDKVKKILPPPESAHFSTHPRHSVSVTRGTDKPAGAVSLKRGYPYDLINPNLATATSCDTLFYIMMFIFFFKSKGKYGRRHAFQVLDGRKMPL